jgi:hypothetical protein
MKKTGIEFIDTTYWKWIINHDCPQEKLDILKEEIEKDYNGCIGKYLFFSKSREELIELAEKALVEYNLHNAKTPSSLRPGHDKYVLCIYDAGPNFKSEMKKYESDSIDYRYWKSDEKTIKGE